MSLVSVSTDGSVQQMMSRITRRCVGPWLLGLFVFAQVASLTPLNGVHFQHVIEIQRDIADDLAATGVTGHVHHHHINRGGDRHDHGADDPADQCCTLHHHLAGVVPAACTGNPHGDLIASVEPRWSRLLLEAEPGRLERPPRLPLTA